MSRSGAKASQSPVDNTNMATMSLPITTNGESSTTAQLRGDHEETCPHQADVKTLREDVHSISETLRCAICSRWMYEPYGLACGHTYCYSCLAQWLGGNQKKTCPDCRTVITQQPTPSYVLRELVLMFASRKQLLPDGETAEEHSGLAKDEAAIVAKDKADQDPRTGGLFKGVFGRGRRLMPMHDPGDGVDRCPRCHWEVEHGMCERCGLPVGDGASDFSVEEPDTDDEVDHDFGDYDGDADDLDMIARAGRDFDSDGDSMGMDDLDPALIDAAFGPPNTYHDPQGVPTPAGRRRRAGGPIPIPVSSDVDDSDEDDDEHDSELDAFIDDEAEESASEQEAHMDGSSDRDSAVHGSAQPIRRRGRAQVVVLDDEEEPGRAADAAIPIDDSEDDAPVRGSTGGQNKRSHVVPRRGPVLISDDDESESDDGNEHNARPNPASFGRARSVEYQGSENGGRAPSTNYDEDSEPASQGSIRHDYHDYTHDDDEEDDDSNDDHDSDEDDEDDDDVANGY
ncbi:E3 ubiquitin ligase [Recurvomyces mirabilis]|uniref:E3 ubiquitin ligase n=1 Tax=Recurvomyces mirabilis TaxID=574656 RepID=A0AAE0WSZ7_9PEZI|nr:E3 ubiquitin ligase [Recurvomyces mirabilis]KAK5157306.1 E3 ubiquitin ligase [Recurvomyces mirabilis]